MPEPVEADPVAPWVPELGGAPADRDRAHRPPAQALMEAAEALGVIAANLDPNATGVLGIGQSDQRTASTPGPVRVPLLGPGFPQTVLPQNRSRRGLLIFHENPGAATLFICYGNNASPLQYTHQVAGGVLFVMPPQPFYIGEVSVACSAATGAAMVTELV